MYILGVIKTIFAILDSGTKKRFYAIQLFFLISAIFQVVGIASIGPFISILSNPNIIHTNSILSQIYSSFPFTNDNQFIIAAAAASLVMILLANAVAGLTIWLTYRFSVSLGSSLQQRIYKSFLYKDYIYHKTENYNRQIAIIAQQIPRFVYMVFQPFLLLNSHLFVAALIMTGLVFLDPLLAVIAAALIGGSYIATYIYLRKRLSSHGKKVSVKNDLIQKLLSESFIGIKDVKLDSMEQKYISRFNEVNVKGLRSQAFISLSGEIPKFIIESISFGAILILALVLLTTRDSMSTVVPILSLYALAGYKLLPTMQQIYKSLSGLSGHGSVAKQIYKHINSEKWQKNAQSNQPFNSTINRLKLKSATFFYPSSKTAAIKDLDLDLEKGNIYSLVGESGSGKSTLADIILGLLKMSSGELVVNDQSIKSHHLPSFRRKLGYVSQSIFILEDSVIRNVAFGLEDDEIDVTRVRESLKLADALDFVEKLPKGIHTNLGQDGKLLSGGQRQRIGIARALYKESDLLLLDEPTSALDLKSERKLMLTLQKLKSDLIILIISHRPTAIAMSDIIIMMQNGEVTEIGKYNELLAANSSFKNMVDSSKSEAFLPG